MNKLFSFRVGMGVLVTGAGLFAVGALMVDRGLFKNILGVCVPRCPLGALCTMVVRYCSESAGEFLKRVSPLLAGGYLVAYVLKGLFYGRKQIKS